jgi:hypothetical protein
VSDRLLALGICRSTTLSERLATMRSTSVDHDGARCKILEATPIHRDDQGRQREGDQEGTKHRSRETERLHIQPYHSNAAQQLPEAATGQPGQHRGFDKEDRQDHPRPPATAGKHPRAEEANSHRHARCPVDDQCTDPGPPARQGSPTLRWQAETLARIGLAGRGCIGRVIRHLAEATWRAPVATCQRRVVVLHA